MPGDMHTGHDHGPKHEHEWDHGDHSHKIPESFDELRSMALESLLIEKGVIASDDIDKLLHYYVTDIGPMNGAKLVARAWLDPEFKKIALESGVKALEILGIDNPQSDIIIMENKPGLHHVVVCTLCSCYPWALLGLPPVWYKSTAYRARVVMDPRSVLNEFGVELPETTEIRVVDSNAEVRYIVMPERPAGTEGMNEEQLAALVTRDCMVGTGLPAAPK
jgi:nitrile hydratase